MPSLGADGLMISGEAVSLVPSAARAASGNGSPVVMGDRDVLRLTLSVTAASGTTPSLTVTIQHSADGVTWTNHSSFAAATAVTSERKVFGGIDRFARASWTVTGTTPSFTFSVSGEAT